jgi:hypothetical protein
MINKYLTSRKYTNEKVTTCASTENNVTVMIFLQMTIKYATRYFVLSLSSSLPTTHSFVLSLKAQSNEETHRGKSFKLSDKKNHTPTIFIVDVHSFIYSLDWGRQVTSAFSPLHTHTNVHFAGNKAFIYFHRNLS